MPNYLILLASLAALLNATAASAATPTYDAGSGKLTVNGLILATGSAQSCFNVVLNNSNASPLRLDVVSAAAATCETATATSSSYTVSTGILALYGLSLQGSAAACYNVTLKTVSTTPLRLELATAATTSCAAAATTSNCDYLKNAIVPYATANSLSVTCDATYAYFNTYGIQTAHPMMKGITQTILQVPIAQNFIGSNAWRIPLNPAIAATTTTAVDGPIGLAVNGIPIFNPCKQGGCDTATGGGDTKVQGELDICNGHAGRADDYHYHAAPVCMMADQAEHYWDTHPVGWALDGFGIFGYYNPDGSAATRDSICGGNTLPHSNAPAGYAYHLTDASPYVLSCFRGTPSPDLAGQGGKFAPLREPKGAGGGPGVSNMTLDISAASLAIGATSTLQWQKAGVTYQVLYKRTSSLCWSFTFKTGGVQTATETYCRAF